MIKKMQKPLLIPDEIESFLWKEMKMKKKRNLKVVLYVFLLLNTIM